MKAGTEELQQIIHKISEKAYGHAGQAGPGGPGGASGFDPSQMGDQPGAGPATGDTPDEDVVDVDFEDIE